MGETLKPSTGEVNPIINDLIIGIVGPCSSGKTTLIQGLKRHGITSRHIAQEHSFVPDMWQQITQPDILIFLDVSFSVSQSRRKLDWYENDFLEQQARLAHARRNANLVLNTDQRTVEEVLKTVLIYLKEKGIQRYESEEITKPGE